MEPKPFSLGARIEHPQSAIDLAQYGAPRGALLPAADYSLSVRLPGGGTAYTFCMCPGGEVIAAASESGGVVTNGMSYSRRDGKNANSALLVPVRPQDFPHAGPLGGMLWQREIERRAFEYAGGGYFAPAQLVGDFLAGRASSGAAGVEPSYAPGVFWGDLRRVLPARVCSGMAEALPLLGRRLRGFDAPAAVLTGPETRSSSPVRIPRGADRCSALRGLYPCGEGASWAGGITSAAVDGLPGGIRRDHGQGRFQAAVHDVGILAELEQFCLVPGAQDIHTRDKAAGKAAGGQGVQNGTVGVKVGHGQMVKEHDRVDVALRPSFAARAAALQAHAD